MNTLNKEVDIEVDFLRWEDPPVSSGAKHYEEKRQDKLDCSIHKDIKII